MAKFVKFTSTFPTEDHWINPESVQEVVAREAQSIIHYGNGKTIVVKMTAEEAVNELQGESAGTNLETWEKLGET